jgi:hypothetical protein
MSRTVRAAAALWIAAITSVVGWRVHAQVAHITPDLLRQVGAPPR